jgi:uncharacterized protein (DUF1697 family)
VSVPSHVAFLRGMNLGNRRVKSGELCAAVEALGFEDVATFRASGNVIFGGGSGRADALAKRIEAGLAEALGYDVPVFVRTAAQVRAIAAFEPFDPAVVAASAGKLQVSLLARKPTAAAAKKALALATDEDPLVLHDSELYWLPSGGLLESELDLKAIAGILGLDTRRTKGTMDLIAEKYFAD